MPRYRRGLPGTPRSTYNRKPPKTRFDNANRSCACSAKPGRVGTTLRHLPTPGDPVKEWYEGTVFNDPFGAETVRRAQGIAAEEVQGRFGPQGLDGIAVGLEERGEQVRGMMSFAREGDARIDLSGGF